MSRRKADGARVARKSCGWCRGSGEGGNINDRIACPRCFPLCGAECRPPRVILCQRIAAHGARRCWQHALDALRGKGGGE